MIKMWSVNKYRIYISKYRWYRPAKTQRHQTGRMKSRKLKTEFFTFKIGKIIEGIREGLPKLCLEPLPQELLWDKMKWHEGWLGADR